MSDARHLRLPRPEKVRMMLVSPQATSEEFDATGDLFFEGGRYDEALLFYEKTKTPDRLERVKAKALESGDAFLFRWIERLDRARVSRDEWERVGDRAMEMEKYAFAQQAYERAAAQEKKERARKGAGMAVDARPPGSETIA